MATLQVKNLPDDLHDLLGHRARESGMTMSEYVTRLLRRDLSRPTIEEWLAQHPAPTQRREIDVTATLDAVRVEYAPDEALTPSAQAR